MVGFGRASLEDPLDRRRAVGPPDLGCLRHDAGVGGHEHGVHRARFEKSGGRATLGGPPGYEAEDSLERPPATKWRVPEFGVAGCGLTLRC